jgi:hypothetical protein
MDRVMPQTVKNIAKKAEVSHMLGNIARRVSDHFYSEVQGGFENVAHPLIIDDAFLTTEVLLHSIYHDDVNATRVDVAFT